MLGNKQEWTAGFAISRLLLTKSMHIYRPLFFTGKHHDIKGMFTPVNKWKTADYCNKSLMMHIIATLIACAHSAASLRMHPGIMTKWYAGKLKSPVRNGSLKVFGAPGMWGIICEVHCVTVLPGHPESLYKEMKYLWMIMLRWAWFCLARWMLMSNDQVLPLSITGTGNCAKHPNLSTVVSFTIDIFLVMYNTCMKNVVL